MRAGAVFQTQDATLTGTGVNSFTLGADGGAAFPPGKYVVRLVIGGQVVAHKAFNVTK